MRYRNHPSITPKDKIESENNKQLSIHLRMFGGHFICQTAAASFADVTANQKRLMEHGGGLRYVAAHFMQPLEDLTEDKYSKVVMLSLDQSAYTNR